MRITQIISFKKLWQIGEARNLESKRKQQYETENSIIPKSSPKSKNHIHQNWSLTYLTYMIIIQTQIWPLLADQNSQIWEIQIQFTTFYSRKKKNPQFTKICNWFILQTQKLKLKAQSFHPESKNKKQWKKHPQTYIAYLNNNSSIYTQTKS